jgi:imidazolonepropionase-like amidohydrolase
VEAGKLADLIVVQENPLESISALRNVVMVFKEGEVVVDQLVSQGRRCR